MSDIQISVEGDSDGEEFRSLAEWLREERELRGRVAVEPQPIGPNDMGSITDLISVALGTGGAGTMLASSLKTWLLSRRTTARIKVQSADRTVSFDMSSVEDLRPLIEQLLSGDGGAA